MVIHCVGSGPIASTQRGCTNMVKHKDRQSKFSFEGKRPTLQAELCAQLVAFQDRSRGEKHTDIDLKELLADVETSLKATNEKLNILPNHLDQVKQPVDKHENRLDLQQNRVSDTD
ncbi:hypothetical protein NDU88_001646 [Pleurodeles waltl]|uniref:Uncharacterized protein n=1 Tax=Pleurodeles waltl TaxID=8319 RepID=A0AAV7RDM2_PLEWA|nr:hypothetical protein NDU88_001646 [Pleurodeles waltl]